MTFTLLDIPELFGLSMEVYFILVIIAIPTFFFCKWLFKRFTRTERTRQITTWAATLILTPVVYIGLILFLMSGITYTPSKDFDKSQWLTDREGRFQMAEDIIQSKLLIGKDTNQIKQLLGEPTWRSDTSYEVELRNSWLYDMGMGGGGFGAIFHTLIVKFNKSKVVSVEHGKYQD